MSRRNHWMHSSLERLLPLVAGLFLAGCLYSSKNREGLELSCADLQNGSVNACQDGIITSCQLSATQYRVCDNEKTCSESWQTAGRFRCEQDESLPALVLTTGGSPQGGSNSSGSSGTIQGGDSGGSPGSVGTGQMGGSGSTPTSVCSSTPCVLANTDYDFPVSSLVVDTTSLYFSSGRRRTITSLAKAGGFAVELATLSCLSGVHLAVNSTDLYATCKSGAAGSIIRVSKADGSTTVVATSVNAEYSGIAADDNVVYWGESVSNVRSLHRYVPGGAPEAISLDTSPGQVVLADGYVYWSTQTGVGRIAISGGQTQNLELGGQPKDFALADGNIIALLDDRIVTHSLADNTTSILVQVSYGQALAVKDSYVSWTAFKKVNTVALGGGDVVELVSETETDNTPGSLIVDDTALYWVGRATVYKLERPW